MPRQLRSIIIKLQNLGFTRKEIRAMTGIPERTQRRIVNENRPNSKISRKTLTKLHEFIPIYNKIKYLRKNKAEAEKRLVESGLPKIYSKITYFKDKKYLIYEYPVSINVFELAKHHFPAFNPPNDYEFFTIILEIIAWDGEKIVETAKISSGIQRLGDSPNEILLEWAVNDILEKVKSGFKIEIHDGIKVMTFYQKPDLFLKQESGDSAYIVSKIQYAFIKWLNKEE